MATKASPSPKYKVSLKFKLHEQIYSAVKPSVAEALDALFPKVEQLVSKANCVVTVSQNKRQMSVMFRPVLLRKLFINKTAQEILQKRAIGALKPWPRA